MRAKLPDREGTVDRGGTRLHYEVYGDGEHTMLFVPAWAIVHSRIFKAQVPYFSDRYRVITYDPRGNGKSGRPPDPAAYSIDDQVEDVLAILDAVGAERAILYALSVSGLVACAAAAHFPDRVEAVLSISGLCRLVPVHTDRQATKFDQEFEKPVGWEKFNRRYWRDHYPDFCDFFIGKIFPEEHSTKQIEDALRWAAESDGEILTRTIDAPVPVRFPLSAQTYQRIQCPVLLIHGEDDTIANPEMSAKVAELTGAELHILPGVGHAANARFPALTNTLVRDFLAEHLGTWRPEQPKVLRPTHPKRKAPRRALYLSSPIGLGHARRDLAIARELRGLIEGLEVDWLAQDPVTRLLESSQEQIHPASALLASESRHIEEAAGEHDLNAFQAIRDMDEILIRNFMLFQEALESDRYDLVIADEAWDVDHYWHEHPNLKRTQMVWLTDFVGWVPMPSGGEREAMLTTDYNAEMIGHVEGRPGVRDRAIFVGHPQDIAPLSFGPGLPQLRDWIPKHYEFSGYVVGEHPTVWGPRAELRERLGYRRDESVCIAAVGGSGVGLPLLRRILAAYPLAKRAIPGLRLIVVAGPRIDPRVLEAPDGVTVRAFVPELDRHLAACDLAMVQGGLTTCMELAAAGTPFLYFPLQNHFEQNVHVAHRLDRYRAGRRMSYPHSDPQAIARAMAQELSAPKRPLPVEADGAARAARMIAELL